MSKMEFVENGMLYYVFHYFLQWKFVKNGNFLKTEFVKNGNFLKTEFVENGIYKIMEHL